MDKGQGDDERVGFLDRGPGDARAPTATHELAEVEAQLAEQHRAAARAEAEKRMIGIQRAHGSLRDQYQKDKEALRAAVAKLGEAIQTINARWHKLLELELEARDLYADHSVPLPELPRVLPPAETTSAEPDLALLNGADRRRFVQTHQRAREKARQRTAPVEQTPTPDLGPQYDLSQLPADLPIAGQL